MGDFKPIDTRVQDHATKGQTVISTTAATTGDFCGIIFTAASTVTAMTWAPGYRADGSWVDLGTIPANTRLPGRFVSITLGTGSRAIAIKN